MRTRWIMIVGVAMLAGAVGGALLSPTPADAVAKEIILLQRDVSTLLQLQRDLQSSVDAKHAVLKTLLEQTLDANNRLTTTMGALQKTVQDAQANSGARLDTMATQVQGLSDNLDEIRTRLGKLNQQLADLQNTAQSLDAKCTAGTPVPGTATGSPVSPGGAPAAPPSADVLYSNALRDINSGNYDLARQEFQDYLKYYQDTDLASNAQFYLGEIAYAQKQFKEAVAAYDKVLENYPTSFKLCPARLKRGSTQLQLGQKTAAIRDFREVIRRCPGTEEARRARDTLKELGVSTSPR